MDEETVKKHLKKGMKLIRFIHDEGELGARELIVQKGKYTMKAILTKPTGWNNVYIYDDKGVQVESIWGFYCTMRIDNIDSFIKKFNRYPDFEDEEADLLSIKQLLDKNQIVVNCEGHMANEYYLKPCVIGHAIRGHSGIIYIKTKRKYKVLGLFNVDSGYNILREIVFKDAQKLYGIIINNKIDIKELSELDQAAIVSMEV